MAFDLTGLGALFDFGGKLIDRLIPDPAQKLAAQQELLKMAMDKELAVMANETALIKMQTDINLEQAKSSDPFVSRPRPALMWVGVAGAAVQWLVIPFASVVLTMFGKPQLPAIPIDPNLYVMLGGLMGVGIVARSWEKAKGVAS